MNQTLGAWVVLLTGLTVVSVNVETRARSDVEEVESFRSRTDTVRYELNAGRGMSKAGLEVRVAVDAGKVGWILTDPEGSVRLTGVSSGGPVKTETGHLKPIEGVWILEIRFEDATGSYRFGWRAR